MTDSVHFCNIFAKGLNLNVIAKMGEEEWSERKSNRFHWLASVNQKR